MDDGFIDKHRTKNDDWGIYTGVFFHKEIHKSECWKDVKNEKILVKGVKKHRRFSVHHTHPCHD